MEPETSLTPTTETSLALPTRYDDRLALAGQVADQVSQGNTFTEAMATWTENTKRRYQNDLKLLSQYLAAAQIARDPDALFTDAEAWRGMSYGLVKGFKVWLGDAGYATSTIKGCLSTIHVFCTLAGPQPAGAGVIDETTLAAILAVKGMGGRKARTLDEGRQKKGIPTRRGHKKAEPTPLGAEQALALKEITTSARRSRPRQHDRLLAARDALMMGLLIEHALRCGELAELKVESINLQAGTIRIYRRKTHRNDVQKMHTHTAQAARVYLGELGRKRGPLFTGYDQEKPLSTRAIYDRVKALGGEVGIDRLSPHDLRHHWAFDALSNYTPLHIVQSDGGWETESMPLRYARQVNSTGGSATITERKGNDGHI